MVTFDNELERQYFSERMMVGEIASITLAKLFETLQTKNQLTRDEIMQLQEDALVQFKEEIKKLDEEDRANALKESAANSNPAEVKQ